MNSRGISSLNQVEPALRSYAYFAWNSCDLDSVSQYNNRNNINNDLTSLVGMDPFPAVPHRPANRPLVLHGLRPFRIRKRSRRDTSPDKASAVGVGYPPKTIPPGSTISADLYSIDRGEMLRRREPNNSTSLPTNSESHLLANSPFAKNNPNAVETLLSELYYVIRTKKELKLNSMEIITDLEKIIIHYYNI